MTNDTLSDPAVVAVLDRLHRAARRDWWHLPKVLPFFLFSKITGRSFHGLVSPSMLKGMYISASRQEGLLLYALARGGGARHIVEFGASFGISTLYLAAAVRANGGGRVITTEIEPAKCEATAANMSAAGLSDIVEIRQGDALKTLKAVEDQIDMVFLDGWKDLYVPVLDLLLDRLRPGAVVVADNVDFADTKPYLAHIRARPDFVSALLPGGKVECSWYLP